MKSATQALIIAAFLTAPLVSHAQTATPTENNMTGQAGTSSLSVGTKDQSTGTQSGGGFGSEPRSATQSGAGNETTLSPYSPPIRVAR
ncbi:hypothetical protein [Paraburkholderia sp. C35]|uniref:hypothetical protein n=1 Tax=Paraburkholderia sp. C35 TaxID=2126993 RepID=UPI0013A5B2E7|nr:hypothetical protein [Paraburkholderia sp. C35]